MTDDKITEYVAVIVLCLLMGLAFMLFNLKVKYTTFRFLSFVVMIASFGWAVISLVALVVEVQSL